MTRALADWLDQRWYGGTPPGPALRALSSLFGALAALRRSAFRRGWLRVERMPVPVLVVGNLTVGGAGKTPLTLALLDALRARGWRPGVVARGYGGDVSGAVQVPPTGDPARYGDEPCLIAARGRSPVAVARRRADAARLLLKSTDVDLLIADDGLQHYRLARDVEIVVIDGRRRFGNGRLLPAGPLREPAARARRCALQVVNGGEPRDDEWPMTLQLDRVRPLDGGSDAALSSFAGRSVQAVAGIGDPARFFSALRAAGLDVSAHPFPDHHRFAPPDFAFDDGRPLLMTEKDAVKCAAFARPHWYAVPADAHLPEAFFDQVDALLRAAEGATR